MFCFSSFIYSWIDSLSKNTHIIDKVLKAIYYQKVAQTWAILTLLNPLLQVVWTLSQAKMIFNGSALFPAALHYTLTNTDVDTWHNLCQKVFISVL